MLTMLRGFLLLVILFSAREVSCRIRNVPEESSRQSCNSDVECPQYMYCDEARPLGRSCFHCAFREVGKGTLHSRCTKHASVLGEAIYKSDGTASTVPLCDEDYLNQESVTAACSDITDAFADDSRHKAYIYLNSKCHIECAEGYVPNFNQSFTAVCSKCATLAQGCSWDVDFSLYNCTKEPASLPTYEEHSYVQKIVISALVMSAVVIVLVVVVLRKHLLKLVRSNPCSYLYKNVSPVNGGNSSEHPTQKTEDGVTCDRFVSVDSGYSDGQNQAGPSRCNIINNVSFHDSQVAGKFNLVVNGDVQGVHVNLQPSSTTSLPAQEQGSHSAIDSHCPQRIIKCEAELCQTDREITGDSRALAALLSRSESRIDRATPAPVSAHAPNEPAQIVSFKNIIDQISRTPTVDSGLGPSQAAPSRSIPITPDPPDHVKVTEPDSQPVDDSRPALLFVADLPSFQFTTQDFCQPIPWPPFNSASALIPDQSVPRRGSPEGQSKMSNSDSLSLNMPSSPLGSGSDTSELDFIEHESLESVPLIDEASPLTAHPPPEEPQISQPCCKHFSRGDSEFRQTAQSRDRAGDGSYHKCEYGCHVNGFRGQLHPSNQPRSLRTNVPPIISVNVKQVGNVTINRHRIMEASSSQQISEMLSSCERYSDTSSVQIHADTMKTLNSNLYDNCKVRSDSH